MAQWNCKAVGQPYRPNVLIFNLAELPAVTADRPKAISKVVIHAEFKLPGIRGRQRITRKSPDIKLLQARDKLCPAHGVLPERDLAETVGGFDPVTASLGRPLIFSAEVQRNCGWLPGAVETEGVRTIVLQQMLKRS